MPGPADRDTRGRRTVRAIPAQGGERRPPAEKRGIFETFMGEAPARRAGPARTRLVDLTADWLGMLVALRQAPTVEDAAAIRARALDLKARLEDETRRAGFSAADTESASFALVGFTDETVLRAEGPARDAGMQRPLQLELFGAMLAGEQFFDRLDAMRREREARIEAIEVYYCCLAFGFMGKHAFAGPERLKAMLREIEADIEAVRGTGKGPLAPNAARIDEGPGAMLDGVIPWWMALSVFFGALLLTWILIVLFSMLGAHGDAETLKRLIPH